RGFKSYADYTRKRERGEVASSKRLKTSVAHKPKAEVDDGKPHPRELHSIAGHKRIQYEAINPIGYDAKTRVGQALKEWAAAVLKEIRKKHRRVHSAAFHFTGRVAKDYDKRGRPIWSENGTEYIGHTTWGKMRAMLPDLIRAHGDHDFRETGRTIGR